MEIRSRIGSKKIPVELFLQDLKMLIFLKDYYLNLVDLKS